MSPKSFACPRTCPQGHPLPPCGRWAFGSAPSAKDNPPSHHIPGSILLRPRLRRKGRGGRPDTTTRRWPVWSSCGTTRRAPGRRSPKSSTWGGPGTARGCYRTAKDLEATTPLPRLPGKGGRLPGGHVETVVSALRCDELRSARNCWTVPPAQKKSVASPFSLKPSGHSTIRTDLATPASLSAALAAPARPPSSVSKHDSVVLAEGELDALALLDRRHSGGERDWRDGQEPPHGGRATLRGQAC